MKNLFLVAILFTLASCSSSNMAGMGEAAQARSFLDRLEFEEGETGCFDLRGQIDLNPLPLFSSNVTLTLKKIKSTAGQPTPEC
jgi:hypothetical protein